MDLRRDGWFGQLVISGVATPSAHRGSIASIITESVKDLQAARSRKDADGESEIVIRIRNKPFDTSRAGVAQLEKAEEVGELIDATLDTGPNPSESYEAYFDRLLTEGYPRASALMIAAEWFGRDADGATVEWLNDPKAQRFRELNSRNEAYEAAIPSEYESLKKYVREKYPTFVEHLTFRTA